MAFGKEIKLNPPINHTGEYALAAIVNDKLDGKEKGKEEKEKEYQQVVGTICQEMANARSLGAYYCLPSEIYKMAKWYDGLNMQLFNLNLPRLSEEIVKKEAEKLSTELSVVEANVFELLANQEYNYYLLLVSEGRWIAIKRKGKDPKALDLYDPLVGKKEVFSIGADIETTPELKKNNVDKKTLVIAIN